MRKHFAKCVAENFGGSDFAKPKKQVPLMLAPIKKMQAPYQMASRIPDERCLVLIYKTFFELLKMQQSFIRDH